MAIGENIRRTLEAQGKSMAWLSRQTGIPASTIRSIVHRDGWSIRDNQLRVIANALEAKPADLVYGEISRSGRAETMAITKQIERARAEHREQIKQFGEWLIENADKIVSDIDYRTGLDINCSFYPGHAPEIEVSSRYIDVQMLKPYEQED